MSCTDIAQYDFHLTKGDDETLKLRYKDGDGNPVDITNYLIQFVCSEEPSLNQYAAKVDIPNGRFDFIWSDTITDTLTKNRVSYYVLFYPTGLGGDKVTKFEGSIKLLEVS